MAHASRRLVRTALGIRVRAVLARGRFVRRCSAAVKPESGPLNTEDLVASMPGLTSRVGASLAEAASVCLDDCGHGTPVRLTIDGSESRVYDLEWSPVDDQVRRTWADHEVATEHGACGIAILVVREVRGHAVLERSRKGTGFDYWMGEPNVMPFTAKTRLEVSGIRRGDSAIIATRVNQKKRQMSGSAARLPGIVVVVEFSTPLARMQDQ